MYIHQLKNTSSFAFTKSVEHNQNYQLHCHSCFEVYAFSSGDAEYMIEGQHYQMTPGTVLIMRPNIVHGIRVKGTTPYCRYAFHFIQDYISKEYQELLLAPFYESQVLYKNKHLLSLLDWVLEANSLPEPVRRISRKIRFEAFLTELYSLKSHALTEKRPDYLEQILTYINLHITEHLNIDELCSLFYVSKSQLTRSFKSYLKTTVWNYISLKRINIAKQLIYEGNSIETAAYLAGFSNYSTFYRSYVKITGSSPSTIKTATSN